MRWVVGLVIAVFGLLTFYSIVNPHSNIFVPKCMFRLLTGYDCPACGIQRSLHALLNGDTVTALRYNYFLLISIPYFLAVAITTFWKADLIVKMGYYVQHPNVVRAILVLIIIWWIVRNIPYIKDCFDML